MSRNVSSVGSSKLEKKGQPEVGTLLRGDDHNIQYGTNSDDVSLIGSDSEYQSKCMKLYGIITTMTIEPVVFCFMFGFIMNMAILTNLMMDIGCSKHLNYSSEICRNLSGYPEEKKAVEILATDFSLYASLLGLVAAFVMIFVAPWSDKYGRKLPLLAAVVGGIVTDVGLIICTMYEARLEYLLLAKLPSELSGGIICILMIVYSHASEVTSEKNRTLKYTLVEIAMGLGMAIGGLAGGFLYRYYGYFYVYIAVASLHCFCLLWVVIVVEETTGLDVNVRWSEKAKNFFVCQSFKDGIQATFKSREGIKRALITLILLSMCIVVLTYESSGNIGFVFVHHIYNWDASTYSIVKTMFSLIQLIATLIFVPIFIKVFKFNDYTLGMIGATSMVAKNLIISFAESHVYIYYLGQLAGFFEQLCALTVRTGLSKLVEKEELGKVFSFLATCESTLPMLGNVVVTKVFEATLDIYPNVTYAITAVFLLLPIATFAWAYRNTGKQYTMSVMAEDHSNEKA